jgi:hypothetical protein
MNRAGIRLVREGGSLVAIQMEESMSNENTNSRRRYSSKEKVKILRQHCPAGPRRCHAV